MTFKPFDNETLAALEGAHEDIRVVRGETPPTKRWNPGAAPEPPWEAVFRKPTIGEAENFEGSAHKEAQRPGGVRNYAKALVVGVSIDGTQTVCMDRLDPKQRAAVREAWDALRAKFPQAHIASQDDLLSLSGQTRDEGGKD